MNKSQSKIKANNWLEEIANDPSRAKWAIIITCSILYIQILSFGLVHFDDYGFVLWGSDLLKLSNIPKFFTHNIFWVLGDRYKYSDVFYRPLQNVVYTICNTLSPKHATFYHLASFLLHIASSLALFNLLKELKYQRPICFAFTMLFCVHPVLTEGVSWIGGMGDQLVTVFSLVSVTYFIRIVQSPGKLNAKLLVIHLITFIGAIFSKEIAVAIPLVCLFYFFIINKGKLSNKFIWQAFAGWVIIVIVYITLRNKAIPPTGNNFIHATIDSMRVNGFLVFEYVQKLFLPYNLSPALSRNDAHLVLGLVIVLIIIALFVLRKRITPLALFGLFWFLLFLLPTFIQLYPQLFYELEHRLYLPIAGMLIVIIELINNDKLNFRSIYFRNGFIILIGILFIINFSYSRSYRNPYAFYDKALARSPGLVIAYINYAEVLLDSNKYEQAIDYYKKSFNYQKDINTSGKIADIYNRNLNNPNEAINWFKVTFNLDTTSIPAAGSIADVYFNSLHDTTAAEFWYNKTLKLDSNNSFALTSLGLIYIGKHKTAEARESLNKVLEKDPYNLPALKNMAISYYADGRISDALSYLIKGYEKYPDDLDLQRNLLICYYRLNDFENTKRFADIYSRGNNAIPDVIASYLKNQGK